MQKPHTVAAVGQSQVPERHAVVVDGADLIDRDHMPCGKRIADARQIYVVNTTPSGADKLDSIPGFAFPKSVPNNSFPRWPIGDGAARKIALNKWPFLGARIASLNIRV